MQIYNVPYSFDHEEKIFGGYVSIRQAIYLILGALTASFLFIPFINIFVKVIIFLLLLSLFITFAFAKVDDTNADKYFIYILKYLMRKKNYILEKGNIRW